MSHKTARARTPHLPEQLIWLLIGVFMVRTWVLDGFPVSCQINGGSMAETLLGDHYELTCGDCGLPLVTEAGTVWGRYQAICPNCGGMVRREQPPVELSGDRVLIDKTAYDFRSPRRWEVIAFRRLASGDSLAVKRVVGLPGEVIRIANGDVWADGEIQRKSLAQQRALRVMVHDANYQPSDPRWLPRWHGLGKGCLWSFENGPLVHPAATEPGPGDREPSDWIAYTHTRHRDSHGRIVAGPITDLCSYNQGRPRREEEVNWVPDVQLALQVVSTTGQGTLWLKVTDGRDVFRVRLDPADESYTVQQNRGGQVAASGRLPRPLVGALVELSLFDRQFLLAVDGQTLATIPCEPLGDTMSPCLEPLAIATEGLGVVLANLKVYRDVYYTQPTVAAGTGSFSASENVPVPLQPKGTVPLSRRCRENWGSPRERLQSNEATPSEDGFYVLGDNSPISEDSRVWPAGGTVACRSLLGRPLAVVFPASALNWGWSVFQVPELARIRYIR